MVVAMVTITILADVILVLFIASRPANFKVERSLLISAPAEKIFPEVNDFSHWQAWSPWAKMDPQAKNTFEGSASGVGAVFSWVGNTKVGEGCMTITESEPSSLIRMKLEFKKPFKAVSSAEFTFKPEGSQARVTWSMSGNNNFVGKAMSLVINCDKMVGGQFEQGLASIKAIVE